MQDSHIYIYINQTFCVTNELKFNRNVVLVSSFWILNLNFDSPLISPHDLFLNDFFLNFNEMVCGCFVFVLISWFDKVYRENDRFWCFFWNMNKHSEVLGGGMVENFRTLVFSKASKMHISLYVNQWKTIHYFSCTDSESYNGKIPHKNYAPLTVNWGRELGCLLS